MSITPQRHGRRLLGAPVVLFIVIFMGVGMGIHEGRDMFGFDEFPAIDVLKSGNIGSFDFGSDVSSTQVGSGSGLRDKSHIVHGVDKMQDVRIIRIKPLSELEV